MKNFLILSTCTLVLIQAFSTEANTTSTTEKERPSLGLNDTSYQENITPESNTPTYRVKDHYILNDMTQQSFLDFQAGKNDCIILIEKGTILPLEFLIEGSSFAFEGRNPVGKIIVKEPFFLTLKNNEPYFSKDKIEWKSLFHFWGGQIFCGLSLDERSDQPEAMFKVELNQK